MHMSDALISPAVAETDGANPWAALDGANP